MNTPDEDRLFHALAATWPAARTLVLNPWVIRDGKGGGKRVSAATLSGDLSEGDIDAAAQAMTALGQPPLFQVRGHDGGLDSALDDAGYRIVDPTVLRACPIGALTGERPPRVSGFTIWEPLEIMREIWAESGIGPARIDVMNRVGGARTGLLGRAGDKPAGAGFVALDGDVAMVHALEIRAIARRQGGGRNLMRHAAIWAERQGATTMAVAVTEANEAANALYSALGMPVCGRYHYRMKE